MEKNKNTKQKFFSFPPQQQQQFCAFAVFPFERISDLFDERKNEKYNQGAREREREREEEREIELENETGKNRV